MKYHNVFLHAKSMPAFSMVEIILIIAMIGMFAMLVISPFIKFPDRIQNIVKLKRAYNEFNSVLTNVSSNNGCVNDLYCSGIFASGTTDKFAGDMISKYFKILKNCSTTTSLNCMSNSVSTRYDGSTLRVSYDDDKYKFMTIDGVSFQIINYGNNCALNKSRINNPTKTNNGNSGCSNDSNGDLNGNNSNVNNGKDKNGSGNGNDGKNDNKTICQPDGSSGGIIYQTSMTQVCGALYIDVNGPIKGPNNVGRDIFSFWITNGKGAMLYPMGGEDDNEIGWWKDPNTQQPKYCFSDLTAGAWCAGRIMEESWQMNY